MTVTTAEVLLRELGPEDVPAACRLVEQFDPMLVEEARETFHADLSNPQQWPGERYRLVAECAGQVVGTMGYGRGAFPSPGVLWTDWLVVDVRWRRRGVASRIYRTLESVMRDACCRKACLDVGTVYKQPDAVAFHCRHGYRIEGILQDYWSPGDDLVIMAKSLSGGATAMKSNA
jgi:GNAT superfamily N-acetyltransferase